ncbi:sensor histidine kinase [Mycolicibacterium moriokaense]|uniref:Oxygen sensor histidine kinase NreB n=1 Tax=Mycolicibacterium moriokaense TaxID=39691 RepID=A0A318HG18_9MYCO|nr:sensor histidine kinase [Mycolicibacterium moriokaense]PXX08198.1 signal transduction histidine kinase [Mycolicibacterium moriokaense]
MSQGARKADDWHWLWDVYIVGGCLVGMAAVVLLNDRTPGNMPLAIAALTGIILCTVTFGRRVIGTKELAWPAVVFVGLVVGLFVLGVWAATATVAAIPAMYPLVFATLPLPAALAVSMAVTVTPLLIALAIHGTTWPNMPVAVAVTLVGVVAAPVIGTVIVTQVRQREKLAKLVSELAATRAESARLSREAGAAAERERLAREIHDTLAQGFTSIVALAQAIEPELESDTTAAKRHVELIRSTARENLAEARAMVAELTPTALHDGSLPAALERQCDRLSAENGIRASLRIDGELPPLGMATDVVLLRTAQEAFTNIRKHSQANEVAVALSPVECGVRLSIADNGIGLTDGHADGFGLRGMRARATQVGGTISVSPTPGGGTTVTVEVPA